MSGNLHYGKSTSRQRPHDALRRFADDQGWPPLEKWPERQPFHDAWNEVPCWHSAVLAVRGDQGEIERRLWQAQVTVLFPFL